MNYTIKICSINDINKVMDFINKYWSKGHILSKSKRLVDWQYYNNVYNHYNFVFAENVDTKEILGIIGYIPNYHYDKNLIDDKYVWFTTWKVRNDVNVGGLGMKLLLYVNKYENTKNLGTVGNNKAVEPLYKALGYKVGKLNHFYILNENKDEFFLVEKVKISKSNEEYLNDDRKFIDITDNYDEFMKDNNIHINNEILYFKTPEFYKNRYINHPFYNYKLYGIKVDREITGIFIFRILEHNDNKAIRIVDYYGDLCALKNTYKLFQVLLSKFDAEYVEFYNYGISSDILFKAGFKERNEDNIIIPNYYEPFEMKNVDINFTYKIRENKQYLLFKGDCDQDRPNIIH